jgi:bifunctional DNase/RNase
MPAVAATGFVSMRVSKVTALGQADEEHNSHYFSYWIVLEELDGDRHLVIVTCQQEALNLAATLSRREWPRPMTYQLMAALVRALDGRVREVRLDRVVDGAYAATVEVEGPAGVARGVDARSSDSLTLAVLFGAPIFVAPEMLDDCARRFLEGDSPDAAMGRRALAADPMTFPRMDD